MQIKKPFCLPVNQRIFINGKFLGQRATGVQKYAIGISKALQKQQPGIIVLSPKGKYPLHGLNQNRRFWKRMAMGTAMAAILFIIPAQKHSYQLMQYSTHTFEKTGSNHTRPCLFKS